MNWPVKILFACDINHSAHVVATNSELVEEHCREFSPLAEDLNIQNVPKGGLWLWEGSITDGHGEAFYEGEFSEIEPSDLVGLLEMKPGDLS